MFFSEKAPDWKVCYSRDQGANGRLDISRLNHHHSRRQHPSKSDLLKQPYLRFTPTFPLDASQAIPCAQPLQARLYVSRTADGGWKHQSQLTWLRLKTYLSHNWISSISRRRHTVYAPATILRYAIRCGFDESPSIMKITALTLYVSRQASTSRNETNPMGRDHVSSVRKWDV